VNAAGLVLEAIENFDPAHWHDVLLDGPKKREQMEGLKTIVRRVGEAGIPVLGYNFSLAGVAGRVTGPFARGGATSVGMDGPFDAPMPRGMVWNMWYDRSGGRADPSADLGATLHIG
jgi:mannonate dehydratase